MQFEAKLGARKFEEYVCVGPLRLSEEKLNDIEEDKEVNSDEKVSSRLGISF
jgi:hypothetical protein